MYSFRKCDLYILLKKTKLKLIFQVFFFIKNKTNKLIQLKLNKLLLNRIILRRRKKDEN